LIEGAADNSVTSIGKWCDLPTAAILYDLIPLRCAPDYLGDPRIRHWYREKTGYLVKADFLLGISQESIADAVRFLGYPAERCVNIGGGIAPSFANGPNTVALNDHGITKPYFLYVSGIDERKNQKGLIKAFAALPIDVRKTHQLVLAGHMENLHLELLRNEASAAGLTASEFRCLGHVSEEELRGLYSNCLCFVFPSTLEGFGLPVLEAMAFDKPVICSDIPVLHDVHGLKAAMFNPHSATDMADKMQQVISDGAFRQRLVDHGRCQLGKFTWDATAKSALGFLEKNVVTTPRDSLTQQHITRARREFVGAVRSGSEIATAGPAECAKAIARTFRPDSTRQLLVDISELVSRDARTGIQRVVRTILQLWLDEPISGWRVEPVYATIDGKGFRYARRFVDTFLGGDGPWRDDDEVEVWSGDVFLALDLQLHILPKQAQILQSWRKRGVTALAVIYDLLPIRFPQLFPDGWGEAQADWMQAVAQLDGTISISRTTMADVSHWRQEHTQNTVPTARDSWFHLGADFSEKKASSGLPANFTAVLGAMKRGTAFLMVGTVEPRKGYGQVLDAFEQAWQSHPDLVLVIFGNCGWGVDSLVDRLRGHSLSGKNLFWIEGGSDEFLELAYADADCLLCASAGEGFGLPVVEGARHGVPLLLRDLPVFHEIAGTSASWFEDTEEPGVLAHAIVAWCTRHEAGQSIPPDGINILTWRESAKQLRLLATNGLSGPA
jgi:glycosyltransferase involved in cell wall biosynthesis